MRIAVAGATGLIGAATVRALRARGHDVREVGRELPRESADALVWAAGRRELDVDQNRTTHVEAPLALVRALSPARAIYLSSAECYGDVPVPYREDGPVMATSAYARAKLEGEAALSRALPTTSLRVGVVYGPGQRPHMMIPQLVSSLRAGQSMPLTLGTQTRDFVFVDDVAEAIAHALVAPVTPVVNIGTGVETAVRDMCLAIVHALGAPESLLRFGEVALRPDEPIRYVLDPSLARSALGWSAATSIAQGVRRL
jgi:nucleoside-diphosphate-sugar epimerase